MRGAIKKLLFINVTVYLPFLFEKNLNKKAKYSIYGDFPPIFSVEGSSFQEK